MRVARQRLYDYLKEYFGAKDLLRRQYHWRRDQLRTKITELIIPSRAGVDRQPVAGRRDKDGNRRLDDPNDYVRLEVATALKKNVVVIPILLQGAQMPAGHALPDVLCDLSMRNAIRLNDDHWNSDCNLLAGVLKNALNVSRSLKEQKIRRYTTIVFALAALATLASIINFLFFSDQPTLVGLFIQLLSFGIPVTNIALVTYLLGSIKKELDRLSWIIISMAIGRNFRCLGRHHDLLAAAGDDLCSRVA
jgi:hypothetical protein